MEKTSKTKLDKSHIAERVSKVARIKKVRRKMVAQTENMGKNGGIVMDGRDIGSVVFLTPNSNYLVTASVEVRTQRRLDELKNNGVKQNFDEVKNNLSERDYLDSTSKESPLIQTQDAIVLDNSNSQLKNNLIGPWPR